MEVRLGSTGIVTSNLVLGCDRLGSMLTVLNGKQSQALLKDAYRLGIRHFDTANIYGQGDSERYIGNAFKSCRNDLCLATKAGQQLTRVQSFAARFKLPIRLMVKMRGSLRQVVRKHRDSGVNYCFDANYIEASLNGSLKRLQTGWIDIFYLHSPPVEVLRDEKLMRLLRRLRNERKIRSIGVSCDNLEIALAAASHPVIDVVQYDLVDSSLCQDVIAAAARNGKVSLVRGIARRAAQNRGRYEEQLISGFQTALTLPSVGGVIIGTTNVLHLHANIAAFGLAAGGTRESAG